MACEETPAPFGDLQNLVRLIEQQNEALAQLLRLLELHGEALHRLERKLDQHFAVVEPETDGPAGGV